MWASCLVWHMEQNNQRARGWQELGGHNDIWLIRRSAGWARPQSNNVTKHILKHDIITSSKCILQTWTTGEDTQDISQTDTGSVHCGGDAEKAGNFVCQSPTVSTVMRCCLHSPLDSSTKREAYREEMAAESTGTASESSDHRMQKGGGAMKEHLNTVMQKAAVWSSALKRSQMWLALVVWLVLRRGNMLCRNKLICWFNNETIWMDGWEQRGLTSSFNTCKTLNIFSSGSFLQICIIHNSSLRRWGRC